MPQSHRTFELNTYDPEYARLSASAPFVDRSSNGNEPGVRLTDLLRRRRKALIICFLAAVCCAVFVTLWFRASSWKHKMVTNYVPVANRNIGVGSPEVSTLKSFLLAPQIEQAMRTEFPDYEFEKEFDETFDVKVPFGTDTIEIELESSDDSHAQAFRSWVTQFVQVDTWRSPPRFIDDWKRRSAKADAGYQAAVAQSQRLLNRLREVFAQYVADRRQAVVKARLDEAQRALDEWTEKLTQSRAELTKFNREHRVRDLQAEASALMAAVTAWEDRLEEARLAKTSTDQELAEVQRRLNALKKTAASTQETARDLKQLGDSPQRQIEREKRRLDFEKLRSEVARARKQFSYDTKLHEKRFISDAEFEQKQITLAALEEQLKGAEKIWNLELQIEEENIALGGTPGGGVRDRSLDLELQSITGSKSIEFLEKKLEEKQDQLTRLHSLRDQAERLDAKIAVADGEMQRALSMVFQLSQLEARDTDEFSVIRAATIDRRSWKSNGKKLFVVAFILFFMAFATPVVARDLLPKQKKGAEAHAVQLGIPVLVEDSVLPKLDGPKPLVAGEGDERSRLLALRIQQAVPRGPNGSVVLFSGLDQAADVSLMSRLAACWARRGERVLLLDSGDDVTVQEGLSELLAADQITLDHKESPALGDAAQSREKANGSLDDASSEADGNLPVAQSEKNGLPQVAASGLSNFLKDDDIAWDELLQSTAIDGVDCVMAGDLPMPVEGLATHRMTEFLNELKQRYSLIVLMGPSTRRPVDLELLAARADGIVFSTDGRDQVSERSQAAVKNLVDLNAPVLGIIS